MKTVTCTNCGTHTTVEDFEPEPFQCCVPRDKDTEVWVNVYLSDRQYGGPEEGGWWYDTQQIIRAVPTTLEHATEVKTRMEKEFSNEGRRSDIGSVLSEGRYDVHIEDQVGQTTPDHRPRYE